MYLRVRRAADAEQVAQLFAELPSLYPLPIAEPDLPILLVRGGSSALRARWLHWWLANKLRPARAATIVGAGHWLFNERDRELCAEVTRFLADYPTK